MLPDANRLTVPQAVDGFILAKQAEGISPKTVADYSYSFRLLINWLESEERTNISIADLTTSDIRRFLSSLYERNLAPKTIRNVHVALSSLWTWAGHEFGLPHIIRPIRAPKAPPPVLELPSREDIEAVIKACNYTAETGDGARRKFRMRRPTALRDKCIILVLLDTGMRAAELCAVSIADVDLKSGSIVVRAGKGGKQRIVYIGKRTRRLLWRYISLHRKCAGSDEPLFVTRNGHPLSVDRLSHLVHDLGERAGVKLWPHLLRHVFATEFLRGGGNTLILQRLLGHASQALLERYVEIAEADLQAAHDIAGPVDRWKL